MPKKGPLGQLTVRGDSLIIRCNKNFDEKVSNFQQDVLRDPSITSSAASQVTKLEQERREALSAIGSMLVAANESNENGSIEDMVFSDDKPITSEPTIDPLIETLFTQGVIQADQDDDEIIETIRQHYDKAIHQARLAQRVTQVHALFKALVNGDANEHFEDVDIRKLMQSRASITADQREIFPKKVFLSHLDRFIAQQKVILVIHDLLAHGLIDFQHLQQEQLDRLIELAQQDLKDGACENVEDAVCKHFGLYFVPYLPEQPIQHHSMVEELPPKLQGDFDHRAAFDATIKLQSSRQQVYDRFLTGLLQHAGVQIDNDVIKDILVAYRQSTANDPAGQLLETIEHSDHHEPMLEALPSYLAYLDRKLATYTEQNPAPVALTQLHNLAHSVMKMHEQQTSNSILFLNEILHRLGKENQPKSNQEIIDSYKQSTASDPANGLLEALQSAFSDEYITIILNQYKESLDTRLAQFSDKASAPLELMILHDLTESVLEAQQQQLSTGYSPS